MANAKFIWTPEGGSQQSYILEANYAFTTKPFIQDTSDHGRAIDGTLRTYESPLKQSWLLAFRNVSTAQKEQLKTIKEAKADLDFYQDAAGGLTFTGRWTNPFNFIETAPGVWTGTIQLEEI